MQTEVCSQAFQTKEDKTFTHHVKNTWMQTDKVKEKRNFSLQKMLMRKKKYINDMKLIWGTHARLIW